MNVAGIDFSSHAVDVVLVGYDHNRPPEWHRFPLVGQDAFERARSVAEAVPGRSSVFWDDTLAVGIEHPAGRHGTGPLLRIQGAILACIPARMLVQPFPPAAWRKAVGLAGNASKVDVARLSAERIIGFQPRWLHNIPSITEFGGREWLQDAHDAHCIALATRQAITAQEAA